MQSRVERNKTYRKSKRKIRLFVVLAVILVMFSLYQVNRSYNALVGEEEASQIIGVQRDEESMKIIVLGEQIKIPQNYIHQGKELIRDTPQKIAELVKSIIEKVGNN
ncbi:hypothetical protein NSA47_02410 [Irregularibacter muris]|uniref:Uncharacterized protein n=1 Tax=Irregularibacter muris TaxID=1796619 RepID=A0AAE3KYY8_9FIRM|nr:hypothetical protein [Irregularibacter muris]MCR1897841.1 hypothetical protein [Irregularibacter muris]